MYSILVPSIADEEKGKDRWKADGRARAKGGRFDTSNDTGELPRDPNGKISEQETSDSPAIHAPMTRVI